MKSSLFTVSCPVRAGQSPSQEYGKLCFVDHFTHNYPKQEEDCLPLGIRKHITIQRHLVVVVDTNNYATMIQHLKNLLKKGETYL